MANPLQLPEPNLRTGGVVGGSSEAPPSAVEKFLASFLQAKANKGNEDERKARTAIAQKAFDLQAKIHQDALDEKQHQRDLEAAQGKAVQTLLGVYGDALGQHAQTTGQVPEMVQGLVGPGSVPNHGPSTPQGQMSVSGASAGQPGASPMARFGQVLSTLPPEAIPDFVQHFKPIADSAQQKEDFSKAIQMTEGLLTPDQQKGMQLAQTLASAGAPKEMWESFLPMGQLQLAAKQEEIKNAGSARASDRVATKELMRRGLLPPSGLSDYTVNGAAKMFYDYVAREREQVRAASLEQNKQAAVKLIDSLEGSALEIAQANPDWSGPKIKEALKTMSGYSSLPDGVVAKAALEAPKKAAALTAPANETQAKLRVVYGPGRAALATVNAMDSKGQALGIAARLAQTDELKAAAGLGGAGLAAGGVLGAAAGAGIGYLGAPLVRGAGRAVMSTDQQRLWTAAQNLAASIYRPESGAAVTQEEVRQTIERYIPLNTDKPGTRQLKRQLRSELDRTLASVSGLPQQLAKPILDQFLSQQEQRLLDGTSW